MKPALWCALLALICTVELVTHTGRHNGFLESSRPVHSVNHLLPGNGYVSWVGTVPVLHDSDGLLTITSLFLGERSPEATGIKDRRAAYGYLASLAIPAVGAYPGFMLVNFLFWWAGAAAMYWFVRRRWGNESLAMAVSFLVATGNGFIFMAGVPMSYLPAYASVALVLALGEWLRAFDRGATLRSWALLGWAAGIASTLYFSHITLLIFWWVYGARRVPWRCLVTATGVALGISAAWEVWGKALVGLEFTTDNTAVMNDSFRGWLSIAQRPVSELLVYLRGGPVAGAAAIRGTLLSAFPYPWWALAALGFLFSPPRDRNWALGLVMSGLLPAILVLALLPLPRLAYYMYPAMMVLAARGALRLGPAPGAIALGGLALVSNLDVFGLHTLVTYFHESMGASW
jgi:hypothetical protein